MEKSLDVKDYILPIINKMNMECMLNKADAITRCITLGNKFVLCFHNIYTHKGSENNKQLIEEMSSYFKEVKDIVLEEKNRKLLTVELIDWFFTVGSDYETLIEKTPEAEIIAYDEFVTDLICSNDISSSLRKIGLIDNLNLH